MAASPDPSQPNKKPNPYNDSLKYSGLAIQFLVTIGVCGWLGYKLDRYLHLKYPVFMILFGFLGFGGVLYQLYRSLNRP